MQAQHDAAGCCCAFSHSEAKPCVSGNEVSHTVARVSTVDENEHEHTHTHTRSKPGYYSDGVCELLLLLRFSTERV